MKIAPKTTLYLVAFLFVFTVHAQKKENKQVSHIKVTDSLKHYHQSDIFTFPNLNTTPYYHSEAKLKQISRMQGRAQYEALRKYVQNFGPENFPRDIALLWELGLLAEEYGQTGEALLLYKLILKHHLPGDSIQQVVRKFNLLEPNSISRYVPLQKYYEMVEYRRQIDTLRPPQSVLLNMGNLINSDKEDYGPTMGNSDTLLLFTSKREGHNERRYNEDIFYTIFRDGYWQKAQELYSINTFDNEGSACLNHDGTELYFSRCDARDSQGSCDLYVAKKIGVNRWGEIKNLGEAINSVGWDSQPSLSPSGDTLYFASNRRGSFGLTDIYFSVKKKGKWQKAQNAGPVINTVGHELSPFYHPHYRQLYFSSNGQPVSFGDFDIYKAKCHHGYFDEPYNIGPLVNGAGSEMYFTMDAKSKQIFYARSEEDNKKNTDLFSFPVPMEAKPEAVVNLHGVVKDHGGIPVKGIVSIIDLDQGVEIAPKFLRPDGTYDFILINHRNYLLVIQGDDFFRIEEKFLLDDDARDIETTVMRLDSKIAFSSIEFDNGRAHILPSMESDLDKLGNYLIDHPNTHLVISGHTDSEGNAHTNLKLSQDRANAIQHYLLHKFKLKHDRIKAIGYGSSKPLVEEKTEEDKRINRRVEFEIN